VGWVVIVPPDIIPPIIDTLFKDKLKGGYADLLMFPNWVWLFEVGGGESDVCLEAATLAVVGSPEITYCKRAYFMITERDNQHAVIALMNVRTKVMRSTEDRLSIEFIKDYHLVALVPRFMGILTTPGAQLLFFIKDGKIEGAWTPPKPLGRFTHTTIVNYINNYFPPPFHVVDKPGVGRILFSAIRKIDLEKLGRDVRREIEEQLKGLGVLPKQG
jgi:hypothetical protein